MRIFLICPVRNADLHTTEMASEHVAGLEKMGHTVHWPPRDTDQEDATGYRICSDNRAAIKDADEIHLIWDGKSQGCLFDLGMAFAMKKQIRICSIPASDDHGKSFTSMIVQWQNEQWQNAE